MSRRRKEVALLIVVLVLIAVAAGMVFGLWGGDQSEDEADFALYGSGSLDLANCPALSADGTSPVLSVAPVDLSQVTGITPLGNSDPPQHTIPTNHQYVHFDWRQAETAELYEVRMPADAWITEITEKRASGQDVQDFSIRFAVCDEVGGYFNHLKGVSESLEQIAEDAGCSSDMGSCFLDDAVFVEAGKLIGVAGGYQGNFDVGLWDTRVSHEFVNPARYSPMTKHIVCAWDYYPESLRAEFYGLLEREGDGSCGGIMWDVAGTLQGNWFQGDSNEFTAESWNYHAYFGPDNENAALSTISLGGAGFIGDRALRWKFVADPGFDEVTIADGVVCYDDSDSHRYNRGATTGRVLVELISEDELLVEYQVEDTCDSGADFRQPVALLR